MFSDLPAELRQPIACFLWTDNSNFGKIKQSAKEVSALARVDKFTYFSMISIMNQLKNLYTLECECEYEKLEKKYDKYNEYCKIPRQPLPYLPAFISTKGTGPLLDALFSGAKFKGIFYRSQPIYNSEVEEDIKTLVKLAPESLKGNVGWIRCADRIGPLAVAAFNDAIPVHMVTFLLENGADPNQLHYDYPTRSQVSILHAIKIGSAGDPESERLKEVARVLAEFGGVVTSDDSIFKKIYKIHAGINLDDKST